MQDAGNASAQNDTSSRDGPEGWLDDAEKAGSDAERHHGAFHWPEAATPDVYLHSPVT